MSNYSQYNNYTQEDWDKVKREKHPFNAIVYCPTDKLKYIGSYFEMIYTNMKAFMEAHKAHGIEYGHIVVTIEPHEIETKDNKKEAHLRIWAKAKRIDIDKEAE